MLICSEEEEVQLCWMDFSLVSFFREKKSYSKSAINGYFFLSHTRFIVAGDRSVESAKSNEEKNIHSFCVCGFW